MIEKKLADQRRESRDVDEGAEHGVHRRPSSARAAEGPPASRRL